MLIALMLYAIATFCLIWVVLFLVRLYYLLHSIFE